MEQTWINKHFTQLYAAYWSLFSSIYIACITFMQVPSANTRVIDTVLGFLLGTVVSTIIQYFYGSSNSSKRKEDTLTDIAKNNRQ